jgi:hypothetical protein
MIILSTVENKAERVTNLIISSCSLQGGGDDAAVFPLKNAITNFRDAVVTGDQQEGAGP